MPSGLRIGRIAGIPIAVHWTIGFIAALLGVGLATSYLPAAAPGQSPTAYWLVAIAGTLAFFVSILAHELAHALVARRHDVATEQIELWLLGGLARLSSDAPTPKADALIAGAGPASSLALAVLSLGAALGLGAADGPALAIAALGWLALVNGILGVFNLLPGAPLDGGRLLRAWRWWRHGDRLRATEEAGRAGQFLGWVVVIVGTWLLVTGQGGVFLPLTGVFLISAARTEIRAAHAEALLEGVLVRDVTSFGVARAPSDTDAETMLWQRGRLGPPRVVAVERVDGGIDGLVTEAQLWQVPEDQRPVVRLGELAVPLPRLGRASPDEPLAQALHRVAMLRGPVAVWSDDRLVGVISPERLAGELDQRLG